MASGTLALLFKKYMAFLLVRYGIFTFVWYPETKDHLLQEDAMKLLYAEDERALSEAVADILTYHKYIVDAVYNGEDVYFR